MFLYSSLDAFQMPLNIKIESVNDCNNSNSHDMLKTDINNHTIKIEVKKPFFFFFNKYVFLFIECF